MFLASIRRWSFGLLQLQGGRRNWAAAMLGVCATAALPPVFIAPLVLVAFSGLLLLVYSAPGYKRAMADGWWFGFGYFVTGIYWVAISLLVDAEKFAWLIPLAVFGLSGLFAIYHALACVTAYLMGRRGVSLWLALAAAWLGAEWLRGHLFTGFPWNLAGYVWSVSDISLQLASVLGGYGLTWFTVLLASAPALFFMAVPQAKHINIVALLLLFVALGWGAWRLPDQPLATIPDIKLRIVQASIPQQMKWHPQQLLENLKTHIRLTRSEGYEKITHVIWPETAFPYTLSHEDEGIKVLAAHAPAKGALITGAVREERVPHAWRVYNSVVAVSHAGRLLGVYDKTKLVPFGEFMPFRSILPIEKITGGMGDFNRGVGAVAITNAATPAFSPLVCYEAIFPDYRVKNGDMPQWLLSVTNDGWFGNSSGPYQHFEAARMRAVEQGVPLVRAANNGISALVTPYGQVTHRLGLNMRGVLDVSLPMPLPENVLYRWCGEWLILWLIGISIIGVYLTKK